MTVNHDENAVYGDDNANFLRATANATRMYGYGGDDGYLVGDSSDRIIEAPNGGTDDYVIAMGDYALPANVESLRLTDHARVGLGNGEANSLSGNETKSSLLMGLEGDDWMSVRGWNNVLFGGPGHDVLRGGQGRDAHYGGSGDDDLYDLSGRNFFAGGKGNDRIVTLGESNVIAFNRGDGSDVVIRAVDSAAAIAPPLLRMEHGSTISLGGISRHELALARTGGDLVIRAGEGDQILLKDWFLGHDYHHVTRLQIVTDSTDAFDENSKNPVDKERVSQFDFMAAVRAFERADVAEGESWRMNDALLASRPTSSSEELIGGQLAYEYAHGANYERKVLEQDSATRMNQLHTIKEVIASVIDADTFGVGLQPIYLLGGDGQDPLQRTATPGVGASVDGLVQAMAAIAPADSLATSSMQAANQHQTQSALSPQIGLPT